MECRFGKCDVQITVKIRWNAFFHGNFYGNFPIMSKSGDPLDGLGIRGLRWNAL